jgi:SWI/SNF-related matrix-associated actin-dependent regulator 1 of chromatin subfamily A
VIELFPHQHTGIEFLAAREDALLADDMGLGKSAQCVRGLDKVQSQRAVIFCPSSARMNWKHEIEMFSQHEQLVSVLLSGKDTIHRHATAVVCGYDLAKRFAPQLLAYNPDSMICDEFHYCKEPNSARTKAVMSKEGVAHNVKRRWLVTGTPILNHAGELWVALRTAGRTPLEYDAFIRRYCLYKNTPFGLKIVGNRPEMVAELRGLLDGFMLRRKKEDVMKDLPKIRFGEVALSPGRVKLGDLPCDETEIKRQTRLVESLLEGLDANGHTAPEALAAFANSTISLRQYTGLQKVQPTLELLKDELDSGLDKIVVFAIHKAVIEQLAEGFAEYNPVVISGSTPAMARDKIVQRFQNDPTCRVFIGNIHAAGTAITLTAAASVFFAEYDWVPANNAQAAMRAHRIGQTRSVLVRFGAIADSLDQKIQAIVRRKTKDICAVID